MNITFIDVILFIAFWFIGTLSYSLFTIQLLLTLTCSIPAAISFEKHGGVLDHRIFRAYAVTIVSTASLTAATITLVLIFGSFAVKLGFFIGFAIAFFVSFGKLGMSLDNMSNWSKTYERYIVQWPPKNRRRR